MVAPWLTEAKARFCWGLCDFGEVVFEVAKELDDLGGEFKNAVVVDDLAAFDENTDGDSVEAFDVPFNEEIFGVMDGPSFQGARVLTQLTGSGGSGIFHDDVCRKAGAMISSGVGEKFDV